MKIKMADRRRRKVTRLNFGKKAKQSVPMQTQYTECCFCHEGENEICGTFFQNLEARLAVHQFCLFFSAGLPQLGDDQEGFDGFLYKDILREANRSNKIICKFCQLPGASSGCCIKACRFVYHYKCGLKEGIQFMFFGRFNTYCQVHRSYQDLRTLKTRLNSSNPFECPLCLEYVVYDYSQTLRIPCCKNVYAHKSCIQRQAMMSGYFFRCPTCNNESDFQHEMSSYGIYIPQRDAAWEENNAYSELLEQYQRCDSQECRCPKGSEYLEENGSWELLICFHCGQSGIHRQCLGHHSITKLEYVCYDCNSVTEALGINAKSNTTNTTTAIVTCPVVIVERRDERFYEHKKRLAQLQAKEDPVLFASPIFASTLLRKKYGIVESYVVLSRLPKQLMEEIGKSKKIKVAKLSTYGISVTSRVKKKKCRNFSNSKCANQFPSSKTITTVCPIRNQSFSNEIYQILNPPSSSGEILKPIENLYTHPGCKITDQASTPIPDVKQSICTSALESEMRIEEDFNLNDENRCRKSEDPEVVEVITNTLQGHTLPLSKTAAKIIACINSPNYSKHSLPKNDFSSARSLISESGYSKAPSPVIKRLMPEGGLSSTPHLEHTSKKLKLQSVETNHTETTISISGKSMESFSSSNQSTTVVSLCQTATTLISTPKTTDRKSIKPSHTPKRNRQKPIKNENNQDFGSSFCTNVNSGTKTKKSDIRTWFRPIYPKEVSNEKKSLSYTEEHLLCKPSSSKDPTNSSSKDTEIQNQPNVSKKTTKELNQQTCPVRTHTDKHVNIKNETIIQPKDISSSSTQISNYRSLPNATNAQESITTHLPGIHTIVMSNWDSVENNMKDMVDSAFPQIQESPTTTNDSIETLHISHLYSSCCI